MKKIAFLMLIISAAFTILSCSGDSGGDTEKGYVDPGDWTGKDVNAGKRYNFNHATLTESCGPNAQCNAIIYQNKLNNTNYVGIAVNNAHTVTPPTFNLKIYWESSTIGSVNLPHEDYTIKVIKGTNEYSSTADNLDITIADQGDGSYIITFNDPITVDAVTINATNSIRAVKYP